MRNSDERNKGIHISAHSRDDGGLLEGLANGIKLVFTNRRAYNRDYTVWTSLNLRGKRRPKGDLSVKVTSC